MQRVGLLIHWYIFQAGSECFFELSFCISLYPTIPTIVSLKNLFLPSCHLPSRPWKRELKRPSWKLGSSEFRLPRSTRIVLAQRSLRWHKTFTHPKGKRAGRMIDPHRSPRFADHRMSRMNLASCHSGLDPPGHQHHQLRLESCLGARVRTMKTVPAWSFRLLRSSWLWQVLRRQQLLWSWGACCPASLEKSLSSQSNRAHAHWPVTLQKDGHFQ